MFYEFTLGPFRRAYIISPLTTALLSGIIAAFTQPPTFYFWALIGFTSLVYLVYSSPTLKEALKRNCLFSLGYFGYGFYWTAIAISTYIEEFWWAIPIAFMGLPLIFTLFTSLLTIAAWKSRKNKHYIMIYTILWVLIEWLTSFVFTGLPWMMVGHVSGYTDISAQLVSMAGILGASFVFFNITATFFYIFEDGAKVKTCDFVYAAILIAGIILYGIWRLNSYDAPLSDTRIRLVQPSIKQGDKWNYQLFWDNLARHRDLTLLNAQFKPDIVIWSEAAIMAPYQIPQVRDFLNEVANDSGARIITGAVSKKDSKYFTSMIGISREQGLLFEYNKQHLVPFGEYVPLSNWLPVKKLTPGASDYAAGEGEKVFEVDSIKIRPLICYESIFFDEIRGREADLYINITNASWYGNSNAPYHLFYSNKFRAIENSTPVIVAANNGISGAFDSLGREIAKTGLNDITSLDLRLPRKIQAFSPYSLLGLRVILGIVLFLHLTRILVTKCYDKRS